MGEPAFTKGPWAVHIGHSHGPFVRAGHRGICRVYKHTSNVQLWHQREPLFAEAQANAHLIAAAPALYEALFEVDDYMTGARWAAAPQNLSLELIRKMRAALAIARGETP